MSGFLSKILSRGEFKSLEQEIIKEAEAGQQETAWDKAQALRKVQQHQPEAVMSLLRIIDKNCLPMEGAADILCEIAQSHDHDVGLMRRLGNVLEAVRDIDDLNAPPPEETVFQTVVERLAAYAQAHVGQDEEEAILRGLSTAARMMARQHDDLAERSYRKLTEINPKNSSHHYNLGLFYKTRGRFEEGMKANQIAASLEDKPDESHHWNLGICATGAGHGDVALKVWQGMDQITKMGRFGLPEGTYPQCKVKLAERPLAERSADDDDPGLEETIWIERLSPCHGIIRSVLYQDLGVDYGDVILIDGAPVTYHTYGDHQIAVFPHLATLHRQNYQFFDFAGTQGEPRQLADVSMDLDKDIIVYSHSESYQEMCANCWRDPDLDHERHEIMQKHVVSGRIAAPGDVAPDELLEQLDKAIVARDPCQLYSPDLCMAAGSERRAQIEQRRFDMLRGN